MDRRADVVVIGAGVVGLAIAEALSAKGTDVLLLDQYGYGRAASGTNLGQLSVIDREPGLELDLVYETLEIYREHNDTSGLEYKQSGGLTTLETLEELEIARHMVSEKVQKGCRMELLEGDSIKEIEPHIENLAGGVFSPEEGRVNPLKVNCWLYDRGQDAGVRFYPGEKVTGFTFAGDRITGVLTEKKAIGAEMVVMATGSWTRELYAKLGLDIPVNYIRGSASVIESCPSVLKGIVEDGTFFTGNTPDGTAIYFGGVQEEKGSIIFAQANRYVDNYNTGVNYNDTARMAKLFLSHYPSLKNVQVLRSWSGVTTVTEDEKPFWGYSSIYRNLFLSVAFKGAFSLAPAVGRRTADWVCENNYREEYSQWSPARAGS